MKPLDPRVYQQIVELLTPLMSTDQDRRSIISLAFVSHPLSDQIDFSGSTLNFLSGFVEKIHNYGKLDDGRPALWAVLQVAREQVGLDQKHRIDSLRPAFDLPPLPRQDRVFISYSRKNERFAQRIVSDLKDAGLRVWFDRQKIKGGEDWWASIESGIAHVNHFVFCLSPESIRSEYALKELLTARAEHKQIYPVMLQSCLDELDKGDFAHIRWIKKLHIIDFTQPENYGERLHELIQSLPGYTPPDDYFIDQIDDRDLPNPFRGLEAFLEVDAPYFFGREDAVQDLLNRLKDPNRPRLLAIVGASGSGKSSLVRAGLIPALRKALPFWQTLIIKPGSSPVNELADRLQERLGIETYGTRDRMHEKVSALDDIAAELLGTSQDARLVVFFDQFEEVFTQTSEDERRILIEMLLYAVNQPNGRVQIILTMRSDFFDRLSTVPKLAKLVRENLDIATEMTPEQLRRSIESPPKGVNVSYEADLVNNILEDVRAQPGSLPLLQYALKELFDRKSGRRMTREAYNLIGGVKGALATRAESIFNQLDTTYQDALRRILLRLVEVGDETITRRRVPRSDLHFTGIPDEMVQSILTRMTDPEVRLLVVSAPIDGQENEIQTYYEVSHEALITHWGRLSDWIAESREDLRRSSEILAQAKAWDASSRSENSYLLTGGRLITARDWLRHNDATDLQREFILRSLSASKRRLGALGLVASLILIVLSLVGLEAFNQNTARQRNAQVIAARQLADSALRSQNGVDRISLAFAANSLPETPVEVQQALLDIVNSTAPRNVYFGDAEVDVIYAAAYSDDGDVYLAGNDGTIITYSSDGTTSRRFGGVEILEETETWASWREFDINQNMYLLSRLQGDTLIFVWDINDYHLVGTMAFPTQVIQTHVARHVSIAATKLNESIVVWDIANQREICTVALTDIDTFALSSDAQILLIDFWDVDAPVMQYDALTCAYQRSHFSESGTTRYTTTDLFIADDSNTVYSRAVITDRQSQEVRSYDLVRWTIDTGEVTPILERASDPEFMLLRGISANGDRAVLWKNDNSLVVVDTKQGRPLVNFLVQLNEPVILSEDGNQVLTTGSGWRVADADDPVDFLDSGRPALLMFDVTPFSESVTHFADAEQIVLLQDASRVAYINGNRVEIFNVLNGEQVTILRGHLNQIRFIAYSPDNEWLVTSDGGEETFIWAMPSGELHHQLDMEGYRGITTLTFSPNSRFLFIGGNNVNIASTLPNASIWDVEQGAKTSEFNNQIRQAAWLSNDIIGFIDANRTLNFVRMNTLRTSLVSQNVVLIDITSDGSLVSVGTNVAVYTISNRFEATLIQVSNRLPTAYGAPHQVTIQGDFAILGYSRAIVVMPLVSRNPDSHFNSDPINDNPLQQIFATQSEVAEWLFLHDEILALYFDGSLERWQFPLGYDATKLFLQEERFVLPLSCAQQLEFSLVNSCAQPLREYFHYMNLNVPPVEVTPFQFMRPSLPLPTPISTVVAGDVTNLEEQFIREINQEYLQFTVTNLPSLDGYEVKGYLVSYGDECGHGDPFLRTIIAPGETCVEILYYVNEDLGFIITASDSPFESLMEWHESSQLANAAFNLYSTEDNLSFALAIIPDGSASSLIYDGVYYSIMDTSNTLVNEDHLILLSQFTNSSLEQFKNANIVANAIFNGLEETTWEFEANPTYNALDFVPHLPSNVAEFTLVSQRLVNNIEGNNLAMNIMGVTSEVALELIYERSSDKALIAVRQQTIQWNSLTEWMEMVDVMRAGTLTNIGGTDIIFEINLGANLIHDSVLMSFNGSVPRSTLFAFIEAWALTLE